MAKRVAVIAGDGVGKEVIPVGMDVVSAVVPAVDFEPLPGLRTPLAGRGPDDIDMLFLRENTEGEYSGTGGREHAGTDLELAVEVPVFTRRAVERVARYAFERARERRRHLISVTKSNASRFTYVL